MAIELKNITYKYESERHEWPALSDISLSFDRDEFVAIIGPTGSGKSTLVQHLNLLIKATSGDILYDGESIYSEKFNRKNLRSKVGLVFQYPEYQLFESDILSDAAFGPKNNGLSPEEAREKAANALLSAGFTKEDFTRSPFELSGGQKRRAAIAGILAMEPEYLVLDEPAAGLDPQGRRELFRLLEDIHGREHVGIILVSHSMDDVAKYADRIIVLRRGVVEMEGTPKEIFSRGPELKLMGLDVPQVTSVIDDLRRKGYELPEGVTTIEEAKEAILKL